MFGTIRRHQQWIWVPVVVIVCLGMVIFFLPEVDTWFQSGFSSGPSSKNSYMISGKPVTIAGREVSQNEVYNALKETQLAYFIRSGGREWPKADDRLIQEAIFRVFLVERMGEMGIDVSEQAAAQMARDRLGSYPYANFEKDILKANGLTAADFERFSTHEAAIQQLVSVAALDAKLLTEQEAELIYRRENQQMVASAAAFWTSNYLDQIKVEPEAVSKFFTNSMARYRIPERIQVSYVEFPATNYFVEADKELTAITNLSARIDDYYFQQGTNAFKDTNGVALAPEVAKENLRNQMRRDLALRAAHQKANDFGSQLMSEKDPNQAENLERLAAADGLEVKVSPPFDRFKGLEELNLPAAFRQVAFNLNPTQPIAFDPVPGTNAIYVVAYKKSVPSEMPAFEDIREKVTTDYKDFEAANLARSAGTNFYAKLTNGMAEGKKFLDLATQEQATIVKIPPFAPSTQTLTNLDERLELRRVQGLAMELDPGKVSPFTATRDGGFILSLEERLPIDPEKMKTELPDLMARLRQYRQTEAFNQWFSKQAQNAPLNIPQPEAPSPQGMPGRPPGRPPGR